MKLLNLIEGRREDILSRFDENPELRKTVEEFLDHEFNKKTNYKYVNWVLKRNFDDFGNTIIPLQQAVDNLERFDKVGKNLKYKDINQYKNIQDLIDTIEVYGDTKSEEKTKVEEDTSKIYEDSEVLIVKPLSQKSSCYYGQGTKWCTSAKVGGNAFNAYNDRGPLYYFIYKNINKDNDYYKIAIHYNVAEDNYALFDAKDNFNSNLLGFLKTNSAFNSIEKDIEENHKVDESKTLEIMLIKLTRKNSFNFSKIRNYVLYDKLVNILGDDNTAPLVVADYGEKHIMIKVGDNDDEIVFRELLNPRRRKSTSKYVYDTRPLYEMVEYLESKSDPYDLAHLLSQNTIHANYKVIRDLFNFFIEELHEELSVGNQEGFKFWQPINSQSNYRFESRNPDNAYIKFLNYIIEQINEGEPASKRDFLLNVLEKDPEQVVFSGYLSTMFSSMKDAGLVSLYRADTSPYFRYKIGPNYNAWEKERLKRI